MNNFSNNVGSAAAPHCMMAKSGTHLVLMVAPILVAGDKTQERKLKSCQWTCIGGWVGTKRVSGKANKYNRDKIFKRFFWQQHFVNREKIRK